MDENELDENLQEISSVIRARMTDLLLYDECSPEETLIVVEELEEELRDIKTVLYDEIYYVQLEEEAV